MSHRFEPLLELARRQQELVAAGRFEDLPGLADEWDRLSAGIHAASPAEREVLQEIAQTVWATVSAVDQALRETAVTLSIIQRGRLAIGSYAGQTFRPAAVNIRT